MTIILNNLRYRLLEDGGFVVGDVDSGNTSYAYPTSEHANLARRMAPRIAEEMAKSANRSALWVSPEMFASYNERMWEKLNA